MGNSINARAESVPMEFCLRGSPLNWNVYATHLRIFWDLTYAAAFTPTRALYLSLCSILFMNMFYGGMRYIFQLRFLFFKSWDWYIFHCSAKFNVHPISGQLINALRQRILLPVFEEHNSISFSSAHPFSHFSTSICRVGSIPQTQR